MGLLYEIQPPKEPVDWTHFDCWFEDEADPIAALYDPANFERVCEKFDGVLASFESTCGGPLFHADERDIGVMIKTFGVDMIFEIIIKKILDAGFDVFEGDTFIEIYSGEKWREA